MKRVLLLILLITSTITIGQTENHDERVKLQKVAEGTKNDSILLWSSNKEVKHISTTNLLDGINVDLSGYATHLDLYLVQDLSVLDFITDQVTKDKIVAKDNTQNSAIVKQGFIDAIAYCKANNRNKLVINDGLYIFNDLTITGLNNFIFEGRGAIFQYQNNSTYTHLLNFEDSEQVYIKGVQFKTEFTTYQNFSLLSFKNECKYVYVQDCVFVNFTKTAIYAENFQKDGLWAPKGMIVESCVFKDTPNYNQVSQAAITLASGGEYSTVINSRFDGVPSGLRMVDGANSIVTNNYFNEINGNIDNGAFDRAVIYIESTATNNGKIKILNNIVNHNTTGMPIIVAKRDASLPKNNPIQIIGNNFLINGQNASNSKRKVIYLDELSYSTIQNNTFRSFGNHLEDSAVILKDSDNVTVSNNSFLYYKTAIKLIESNDALIYSNTYDNILSFEVEADALSSYKELQFKKYDYFNINNTSSTPFSTSTASEDTAMFGITFSINGDKMYQVGSVSDTVYQYYLREAFNPASKVLETSFYVGGQDVSPRGITFSATGDKMYITGYGSNTLYQYNLGSKWEVNTASYSVSHIYTGVLSGARSSKFNVDGSKVFVLSGSSDAIYEYNLSTNYNITTMTYTGNSFSFSTEDDVPTDFSISPDGNTLIMLGNTSNSLHSYQMTTSGSLSTVPTVKASFSIVSEDATPGGLYVKRKGDKLFITGFDNDLTYSYNLY